MTTLQAHAALADGRITEAQYRAIVDASLSSGRGKNLAAFFDRCAAAEDALGTGRGAEARAAAKAVRR